MRQKSFYRRLHFFKESANFFLRRKESVNCYIFFEGMPTVTCLGELEWLHNKQSRTN
jgi:hypothetical protein